MAFTVKIESARQRKGHAGFETNLREERLLPFEGAGAVGAWKLELPKDFRQFDYDFTFTQSNEITVDAVHLFAIKGEKIEPHTPPDLNFGDLTEALNDKDKKAFGLSLVPDGAVLVRNKEVHVFVVIKYSVGSV